MKCCVYVACFGEAGAQALRSRGTKENKIEKKKKEKKEFLECVRNEKKDAKRRVRRRGSGRKGFSTCKKAGAATFTPPSTRSIDN